MAEADSVGDAPDEAKGRTRRRVFFAVSAAVVLFVIIAAADAMLPFVLAVTVAFILTPAVAWVERKRVPRAVAILLVYAVALGLVGGFVALTIPSLVREVRAFQHDLPSRIHHVEKDWIPAVDRKLAEWSGSGETEPVPEHPPREEDDKAPPAISVTPRDDGGYDVAVGDRVEIRRVSDDVWRVERNERTRDLSTAKLFSTAMARGARYVSDNAGELVRLGQAILAAVFRAIFTLFMTLMLAGYMMHTREAILGFFRGLVAPPQRASFDRLLVRLEVGLGGVVRGQLVICMVNGVLAGIGFYLFGLKYWPIMALIAAVGSIIPIFGSILSAIPAVAIGLTQSPGTALGVLAWILGVHQLEANLLNPKIIGDAAKIHPVLVVFSLIVGEHFFQVKGALFAVPAMSIAQSLFLHFREAFLPWSASAAATPGKADPR